MERSTAAIAIRRRCTLACVSTLVAVSSAHLAPAANLLAESDNASSTQTHFDGNILTNDLVENGSSALSSVTTAGSVSSYAGDVAPYNRFANLNDGAASTKITNNDISHDTYFDSNSFPSGNNPAITYTFNTAANPLGYTLSSISTITGWADTPSFSHQVYNVAVSYVADPSTFVTLQSVNYDPTLAGENSAQVTLTDPTGLELSGVAALQVTFMSNGGSGQVYRELDVTGAPTTAPEPASIGLLGLASLLVLRRRSR